MAITEIRETIQMENVSIEIGRYYTLLQKKMELKSGSRHTMMSVDFMDDSFMTLIQSAGILSLIHI